MVLSLLACSPEAPLPRPSSFSSQCEHLTMRTSISQVETAAHAAMLSVIYLTYMAMPYSIATAATIR